jgi:hypothetical protein
VQDLRVTAATVKVLSQAPALNTIELNFGTKVR